MEISQRLDVISDLLGPWGRVGCQVPVTRRASVRVQPQSARKSRPAPDLERILVRVYDRSLRLSRHATQLLRSAVRPDTPCAGMALGMGVAERTRVSLCG